MRIDRIVIQISPINNFSLCMICKYQPELMCSRKIIHCNTLRFAERCHSNIVSRRLFSITLIIFYSFCHIPSCRKLKIQIYASDVCLPSTWKRNVRIRTCNTNRLSIKISLIQSSIYEIYSIRVNHRY